MNGRQLFSGIKRWMPLLAALLLAACASSPGVFEIKILPDPAPDITNPDLEAVRAVASAILSGGVGDRRALVSFTRAACTTAEGLGGPPKCSGVEADGTQIQVFPVGGPEASFVRPEVIDQALGFTVKGLHAIYRVPTNPEAPAYWPTGEYGLLFDREENNTPVPVTVFVQEGRIIRLDYHIGQPPDEVIRLISPGQILLDPGEVKSWTRGLDLQAGGTAGELTGWQTYTNTELGYTLQVPSAWQVDEYGLTQPSKEVIFNPADAEPFLTYLSVLLDPRTLEQIESLYAETTPEAVKEKVPFGGGEALRYRYGSNRIELYILHRGAVYLLTSDKPDLAEVQRALGSFTFIN